MATSDDLLALFPQFGDVSTVTLDAWLAEAAKTVNADWAPDEDSAQIYLACHLMSMAGIGPEKGAQALAGVKSMTSASLSFTKDDNKMGLYGLTSFGRLYYPILIGVRGGPRVTGTGDYPWPYGCGGPNLDGFGA